MLSRTPRRVILAASLALLSGWTPAPGAEPGRLLQAHLETEPTTLDPIVTTDLSGTVVEDLLFTPLLALDRKLALAPGLARSWQVSGDSRTFVFHLDPRATFDDGTPVTAQDVRFTIERIRDPRVAALSRRADFDDLEATEAISRDTVRVRFSKPYSERLLAFNLPIVPEHVVGRGEAAAGRFGRNPVGNGPFRFVRWEPGRSILLERRRDAAGRSAGVERIVFRILSEPATWMNAGAGGELDEFRVPPQQLRRFETDRRLASRFRLLQVPRLAQSVVVWNCRHASLSDARVRRALAMAIPRRRIIDSLLAGRAREVSGPYPAGVVENAPDVRPLPYDPREAGRLLFEAGYRRDASETLVKRGRAFSFDLLIPAGQNVSLQIAQVLRGEYGHLGVRMEIRALDWAALSARLDAGDFDACLSETVFFPPNLDPYPAFHSSQFPPKGQNAGFYRNAALDRLLESARTEPDPAKRLGLHREIHRRLAEEQPYAFLFTIDSLWAIHRDLEGIERSPMGLFHFLPGPRAWRWRSSHAER